MDHLARIKLSIDGQPQTVGGLQEVINKAKELGGVKITSIFDKEGAVTGAQIQEAVRGVGNAAKEGKGHANDFVTALRRAIIVAPIWMAARAGMQFFTQGIQDGLKYLIDFDTAVFKLEQTLKALGTTANISGLKEQFTKLSQTTGKSTAEIATSYNEFIKAGINVQDSIAATSAAVQLQDVTFSKSAEVIRAVVLGYKIFGSALGENLTAEQKSTQIAADLYQASLKNLVGIDELASEFNNFAATGDALGLTLKQTIGLLATLNSEGVKNVTGLKTALFRTFTDTANVAKEFGIAITPDSKPFEIFIAILDRLNTAAKSGNVQGLGQALGEIFGKGGRGGTANVKILSDALDSLKNNIDSTFDTESIKSFNESISEVDKILPHQIELWDNYRKQMFESFIIGITGGSDFANAMEKLNHAMETKLIPTASRLGEVLHLTFAGGGNPILMALIATAEEQTRVSQKQYNAETEKLRVTLAEREAQKKLTEATSDTSKIQSNLNILSKAEQKSDKVIMQQKLNLLKESGLLTEAQLIEAEKELINTSGNFLSIEEKKLRLRELDEKMGEAILKDSKDLIDHELEILKIRGANSSQLFEIESALKIQLYGYDAVKNSLDYQFNLEKKITKEKLNQVEISSDSLSLYKLSQKYGSDAAKDVGNLLSGNLTPRGFENRASNAAKSGFAEFFDSKKEAQDAATFFGLNGGVGGFAEGRNIPITENDIGKVRNLDELRKQFNVPLPKDISTKAVSIQSLQVNVTSTKDSTKNSKEQSEQLQIDIADAIRTDPKVKQAIEERIAEF